MEEFIIIAIKELPFVAEYLKKEAKIIKVGNRDQQAAHIFCGPRAFNFKTD